MKAALFGYGYWGRKLYQVLTEFFDQVVVVDPSYQGKKRSIPAPLMKAAEVYDDSAYRHCFIATPEETHYGLVKRCLLAKKEVFVEKPLALQAAAATELTDLALNQDRCLFVDYIFLFDPAVKLLHKQLNLVKKDYYKVKSYRYSSNVTQKKVAMTDDLLIHDLYLARTWFGAVRQIERARVKPVTTVAGRSIDETQVEFVTDKATYQGYYRWQATEAHRELVIEGRDKKLVWQKGRAEDTMTLMSKNGQDWNFSQKQQIIKEPSPLDCSIQQFLNLCQREDEFAQKERYQAYEQDVRWLEQVRKMVES